MLNSVSNEGLFTLQAKRIFRPYLATHSSGVTEICHVALPAHAIHSVKVRLKWVSNEGQFTLEAQTVFRPYPPSHWSGVNQMCQMALPEHASHAQQVRLNSSLPPLALLCDFDQLALFVAHGEGVPRTNFESLPCNARRDRTEKWISPHAARF
jgi:hypothetical protein